MVVRRTEGSSVYKSFLLRGTPERDFSLLPSALRSEDDEKKKDKLFLFDAKTIVDSLVVPSAVGENPTCVRALREIMGKFDVKISLVSYESVARQNLNNKEK